MRERLPDWLAAALRRAPMGLIQAAAFIVAGGAMIGAFTVAILPPDAPLVVWWVWWIALVFAVVLFLRGLIGAIGWIFQQGWIVGSQVGQRGLPRIRVEWGNRDDKHVFPPGVVQAPKDPKWEKGDQLTFEGSALLDVIRMGEDRHEHASAWLEDVREFLKDNNPQAWAAFDAPTGLLPYRSGGYPKAMVDMATAIDRALFLIRQTNPRIYGRAKVAGGGSR
jgi:hypothetical protein